MSSGHRKLSPTQGEARLGPPKYNDTENITRISNYASTKRAQNCVFISNLL